MAEFEIVPDDLLARFASEKLAAAPVESTKPPKPRKRIQQFPIYLNRVASSGIATKVRRVEILSDLAERELDRQGAGATDSPAGRQGGL